MIVRPALLSAVAVAAALAAGVAGAEEAPTLEWGGYVQARETLRPGSGLTATLNRARLSFDGTLPPAWSLRVTAEYAAAGASGAMSVSLRDAYVRWAKDAWGVQAGQFKTPFGREYLVSISSLETPDRALIMDSLATRRDLGVQVDWSPGPAIEAAVGVFNGEGSNVAVNRDSTVLVVARLAGRPVAGLGLGVAAAAFGEDSTRFGFELEGKARGAWLRAELMTQEADGRENETGWYALAGYRVRPTWSLVARRESLLRPALDAGRSRTDATTLGILWEPQGGRIRGWLDYVERAAGQEPARSHAWIAQLQARI